MLVLYNNTGAMMLVDQSSAQVTGTFPLGPTGISGEAADPVRGLIYLGPACSGGNLTAVSSRSNRIVKSFPVQLTPSALAAGQLYAGGKVYNLETGVSISLPEPSVPSGIFLTWSGGAVPRDGTTYWVQVAFSNYFGQVYKNAVIVYSTAKNSVIDQFLVPAHPTSPIVFSPDSSTAYIAEPHVIAAYSTATFRQTATYNYATTFTSQAVSPDSSLIYGTDGAAVYVLDAATGAQKATFELPAKVQGVMALSPDGATLFLTDSTTNAVDLVDTASGKVTAVALPYTPSDVVVMP